MRRPRPAFLTIVLLLGACGSESADTTVDSLAPVAEFDTRVQALCFDIGERAYELVQDVFPPGVEVTPEVRADEARIRAEATEELVDGLRHLTPPADLTDRWESIQSGLIDYADYQRDLIEALEKGSSEPQRPNGLDEFRALRLGGTCNDWLDMN